jgi:phosphate transport system permease protein
MSTISLASKLSPIRKLKDGSFRLFLTFSIIATLGFIFFVVFTLWNDSKFLLNADLLKKFPSNDPDDVGFQSAIFGSIWVVGVAALFALPIGILTALYLEEFAGKRNRLTSAIETNIQNLAGVPGCIRNDWTGIRSPRSAFLGIYSWVSCGSTCNDDPSCCNYCGT